MRKKITIIMLFIACINATFSQNRQSATFSFETFANLGIEEQLALFGVEYGSRLNYSFASRFGASLSLGSFQSLTMWDSWRVQDVSDMLLSLNLYSDLFKNNRNTLRLSVGATYFRGSLAHATLYIKNEALGINEYIPRIFDVYINNNIGMNLRVSYIYTLSEKWSLGANIHGYEIFDGLDDGLFKTLLSLGLSVGYKF